MVAFDERLRELAQRLEEIAKRLDGANTPRAADEVRQIAAALATLAKHADGEDGGPSDVAP